jgi:hypothetical protein
MSKGEKRVREEKRSECMWVLVLPSMPKGEIVGKYLTDSEWKIFNRQRMLVIDGKYRSNDGLSTTTMINRQIEDKSRKIE